MGGGVDGTYVDQLQKESIGVDFQLACIASTMEGHDVCQGADCAVVVFPTR